VVYIDVDTVMMINKDDDDDKDDKDDDNDGHDD